MPPTRPVCVVVGVAPGLGETLARVFVSAGHAVALLARSQAFTGQLAAELPHARSYVCDVTDEAAVAQAFDQIAGDLGPVQTLVYNPGGAVWGAVDEISRDQFEQAWRTNALGLFLSARRVIPAMRQWRRGNIVVIGATASRRGVASTAAFAPAKMAQRGLAEAMARQLGSCGIHVSLVIVDGAIDSAQTRARLAERSSFVSPDAVAATVLHLTLQERSAWSFEVDLRPFDERW